MMIFQNSFSQQNTSGWYWLNGQPQSFDLKWIKFFDPYNVYAVGSSGNFMKSSDGGDSWLINSQAGVTDTYFGAGNTLDLNTAYFFNSNTGIVAGQNDFSSNNAFIRRTTNAGSSFSSIPLGITDYAVVNDIHFINATTGFLCGNSSVKAMKTTNAGLNWTPIPNVYDAGYSCISATDANHIYLGLQYSNLIARTSNGGSTWSVDTLNSSTFFSIEDIIFTNSLNGYASGNAYFGYTTNGGTTWIESAFPNPDVYLYDLLSSGPKIYALGSFTTLYTTSNNGATWDSLNFEDQSNPNQADPFFMYAMDILGGNIAVVGSGGKINISNDDGATWRNKNYDVGKNYFSFYDVFAESGNGNVWALGNGYGNTVLFSSNGGTNWVQYNTGAITNMYDICMINSSTGFCSGGNAFWGESDAIKTTDGGVTWSSVFSNGSQLNSVDFIDPNIGWIFGGLPFGGACTIVKTTDGGTTWIDQFTNPPYSNPIANGNMYDAKNGFCVSGSYVFKTTDGTVWNKIQMPNENLSFEKVTLLSKDNVIIGGANSIYKSINGGLTWDSVFLPNSLVTLFSMDWADSYNGIVSGTSGYTAKTSDGGITWTERNTGGSTLVSVQMIGKDTVFTCSDRNGSNQIFRLYDNQTSISFNMTIGLEGFWNGATQVIDTVKCYLHSPVSPYNIIDSSKSVLGSDGFGSFIFKNAAAGSYFIDIRHRNSIQTWNASPVPVVRGGNYDYDFTTSAGKAFGGNLVLQQTKYCFYTGDVNQDGFVELVDLTLIDNAVNNYIKGYVSTDLNGDNFVDVTDYAFADNNAYDYVEKIVP